MATAESRFNVILLHNSRHDVSYSLHTQEYQIYIGNPQGTGGPITLLKSSIYSQLTKNACGYSQNVETLTLTMHHNHNY